MKIIDKKLYIDEIFWKFANVCDILILSYKNCTSKF